MHIPGLTKWQYALLTVIIRAQARAPQVYVIALSTLMLWTNTHECFRSYGIIIQVAWNYLPVKHRTPTSSLWPQLWLFVLARQSVSLSSSPTQLISSNSIGPVPAPKCAWEKNIAPTREDMHCSLAWCLNFSMTLWSISMHYTRNWSTIFLP